MVPHCLPPTFVFIGLYLTPTSGYPDCIKPPTQPVLSNKIPSATLILPCKSHTNNDLDCNPRSLPDFLYSLYCIKTLQVLVGLVDDISNRSEVYSPCLSRIERAEINPPCLSPQAVIIPFLILLSIIVGLSVVGLQAQKAREA